MTRFLRSSGPVLAAVLAAGCVELPSQPTVAVMPGPYKPFEIFQADDQICRGYAQVQVGGATTTPGGTADGGSYGYDTTYALQYRYNVAYEQCMYSKGNVVPGFAQPPGIPPPQTGQPPVH